MSAARLRFTIAALVLAPVLSGCVVFKATPTAKQIDADTVRVKFTVCASTPSNGTCPDTGNSSQDADEDETNVLLLGLRVPIGSRLPDQISPVRTDVPGVLRRSSQYGGVLNDEAPTPVGFKWVGYRSGPRVTDPGDAATFKVRIGLPSRFDQPRFRFRPVVGFFQPDPEHPADSPIVCGDALFDREIGDDGERACIDSPTPDETARHLSIHIE